MRLFAAHYETGTVGTDGVELVTAQTRECAEDQAWELAKENADQYDDGDQYEYCSSWVVEITNYDELENAQCHMCGSPKMEEVCAEAIRLGYKEDWLFEAKKASEEHKREQLHRKAKELREQIAKLEGKLSETLKLEADLESP